MSNLIPTPRADKNGKVVIRHVKHNSARSAKLIPAPFAEKATVIESPATPKAGNFITRWQDRRQRRKATEALIEALFVNKSDIYGGVSAAGIIKVSDDLLSTEEVRLATDVARLVTRSGVASDDVERDRKHIIWSIRRPMERVERIGMQVRAVHAHKDWLEEHPGEAWKLNHTIETLLELGMVSNGGNDGIDHLNEYMAAATHIREDSHGIYYIWRKDYLQAVVRHPDQIENIVTYIKAREGFKEEGFDDFLSAASKHPDKMDRMLDYMRERDDFDEAGFEQYLNTATPLAGGAL